MATAPNATSARLVLPKVRLAFPAIFSPQAIGDGEPAYGAKFPIDPASPVVNQIEAIMLAVANEKWGAKGGQILEVLKSKGDVAFQQKPYTNKNGEPYDGFENMFFLSTRNPDLRPGAFDANDQPTTQADGVIYGGCYVHASVEFWAQDNRWGRRLNCNLRGVKFAGEGARFGGTTAAKADDFAGLPSAADTPDFV